MALPNLIELAPLRTPVQACVTVPGSKSITNRAMILAALSSGETELRGALWSEDTQVMASALSDLGYDVKVVQDPHETANRTITVRGRGGQVPPGGTHEQPKQLFVGNAGTAARFLTAMVCLGSGTYRLHGVPRMHERPQAALFDALRQLGYRIDTLNNKLPVVVEGGGPRSGRCTVSLSESSQFASALYLSASRGGWTVDVAGDNGEESQYVAMTRHLIRSFPHEGGGFGIEPDASSGSYFWAAGFLNRQIRTVEVSHWPQSGWQVDAAFPRYWPLPSVVSRNTDLGDSIMTAMILAPWSDHPVVFKDLGRLRVQECERVAAMRTELTRCGAKVEEDGDTLVIHPSALHGADIETYGDHRMAMCFAVAGTAVEGIRIKNPACVKKTFPNFFQKLAAPPPDGLGVVIKDAGTGARLEGNALLAE